MSSTTDHIEVFVGYWSVLPFWVRLEDALMVWHKYYNLRWIDPEDGQWVYHDAAVKV